MSSNRKKYQIRLTRCCPGDIEFDDIEKQCPELYEILKDNNFDLDKTNEELNDDLFNIAVDAISPHAHIEEVD